MRSITRTRQPRDKYSRRTLLLMSSVIVSGMRRGFHKGQFSQLPLCFHEILKPRSVSADAAIVSPLEDVMNNSREFLDATPNEAPVRGFLHQPIGSGGDCLVLTHGAGANCGSQLLLALAVAFCDSELTVLRCDLPFRQMRPHGPHRAAVLNSTNRDFERQLDFSAEKLRAECSSAVIRTEGGKRRCSARPNPVSSTDSYCSHTRFTHHNDPMSYERITRADRGLASRFRTLCRNSFQGRHKSIQATWCLS
jgi:hypothetical protein